MNQNLQQLMEMGQQLQAKISDLQANLDSEEIKASAGGGMVRVVADGKGEIKEIDIDPAVVDPGDVELLEDLVLVAVSEVRRKARKLYEEEMKRMTGGLPLPTQIPGLF